MSGKSLAFVKMAGAGNDFIVIDNRKGTIKNRSLLARRLCDRRGIGADGMILVEDGKAERLRMRYFNRDGSEAEMCGNGGRCFARFVSMLVPRGKEVSFDALDGHHLAKVKKDSVSLKMSEGKIVRESMPVSVLGESFRGTFMSTGVPHFVTFVKDLEKTDVFGAGRKLRNHPVFGPKGTNVDFVEYLRGQRIRVRTYERGVEAETLGCGTGVVASSLAASLRFKLGSPVLALTQSGVWLKVSFKKDANTFSDIWLDGDAEVLFEGNYCL